MKSGLSAILSGAIVSAGIVAWSFLLSGDWPPRSLLAGASIGGMASPPLWGWIARRRAEASRRRPTG